MPGPPVDLVDETFIVAERTLLARRISDPALWLRWWPDLRLTVVTDRGLDGIRWSVAGALSGTAEIWLEPWQDGVIATASGCGTATRPPSSEGSMRSRTTSSVAARQACPVDTADR